MTTHTKPPDRDAGFMLTELVVAIMIIGIIAVPLMGLLASMTRQAVDVDRAATRTTYALTAAAIVPSVPVIGDPCEPLAMGAALAVALDPLDNYTITADTDCTTPGSNLVTVHVTDIEGVASTVAALRAAVTP